MSILSARLGVRALLAAALYSCFLSAHAHAVTSSWNTDASGSFTTAGNWDNGVPGSDDTAEFNRGFIAYTVSFPGNSFSPRQHVIDRLVVRTNEVSFVDSPLFVLPPIVTVASTSSDSIVIGDTAGDVAILNTTLSSFSGANLTIGRASDANGTLNVDGTLSLSGGLVVSNSGTGTLNVRSGTVSLGDYLRIANSGTGTLNITGGGRVSTGGDVDAGRGGTGTVNVSGAGSSLMSAGSIVVATSGLGALNVLAGGAVVSESGSIGFVGLGAVQVDGAGSTWTTTQSLSLGPLGTAFGTGRLDITNGGKVSSAQGSIGNNPSTASKRVRSTRWRVECFISPLFLTRNLRWIEPPYALNSLRPRGRTGGSLGASVFTTDAIND